MNQPRFEPYQDNDPKRTKRCWSVFENDGSVDGRCVCTMLTQDDAALIAKLLNAHTHLDLDGRLQCNR